MTRTRKGSGVHSKVELPAFGNVRDQLAYCGLWCGSCSVGNGLVNELARRCAESITDYGVHEWGTKEVDYEGLLKGLATLSKMDPCRGCIEGGGRTDCEIRACATGKGIAECSDCGLGKGCPNIRLIGAMRSGAKGVGMKVKATAGDREAVLRKWISEMDD